MIVQVETVGLAAFPHCNPQLARLYGDVTAQHQMGVHRLTLAVGAGHSGSPRDAPVRRYPDGDLTDIHAGNIAN